MENDNSEILGAITRYLDATGIAPTRFGKLVNNDPSLVSGLIAGREPRRSTVAKIMAQIAKHPGVRRGDAA
jgi:predicted transcriptional regulator